MSELVVVEVRVRYPYEHKVIGVVRGDGLLNTKDIQRDAEGGLHRRLNFYYQLHCVG
jgi:hypothetical protein